MNEQIATALLEKWYQVLLQKGKTQHTLQAYRRGMTHFVRWYEHAYQADFSVNLVMPRDVRSWKSYQQAVEKVAPATINLRLVAVNRFFTWAVNEKLCHENPTAEIGTIRLETRQPKGLKAEHLRRLLRAAKENRRDYAIIETMAGTGIRVGELLALQVGDLKLADRSGSLIVRQGKHDNFREIPLTVDVRKALTVYLKHEHPDPTNPQALLWQGRTGYLNQRSSIKRLLEKYAHLAKIQASSPHVLRHTFATRYLAANPDDLRGLARLLGHSNLNTVMIYTEPDMDTLTTRMERVEMLME